MQHCCNSEGVAENLEQSRHQPKFFIMKTSKEALIAQILAEKAAQAVSGTHCCGGTHCCVTL